MDVNYFGSVFATRAVIPAMKTRLQGRVVFLSSQAGQVGLFGFSGYSAAKFALRGLAESLQMEVGHLMQTSDKLLVSVYVYTLCSVLFVVLNQCHFVFNAVLFFCR